MDIATIRQELDEIRTGMKAVNILRSKAEMLRLSAQGGAIRYDKASVQTTPGNWTELALCDAADADIAADRKEERYRKLKSKYLKLIQKLDNELEQTVLIGYYFNGNSMRRLVKYLDKARSSISRTKELALIHLSEFF